MLRLQWNHAALALCGGLGGAAPHSRLPPWGDFKAVSSDFVATGLTTGLKCVLKIECLKQYDKETEFSF